MGLYETSFYESLFFCRLQIIREGGGGGGHNKFWGTLYTGASSSSHTEGGRVQKVSGPQFSHLKPPTSCN